MFNGTSIKGLSFSMIKVEQFCEALDDKMFQMDGTKWGLH